MGGMCSKNKTHKVSETSRIELVKRARAISKAAKLANSVESNNYELVQKAREIAKQRKLAKKRIESKGKRLTKEEFYSEHYA